MAKVLFWSDAGAHTGFATVTHAIGGQLMTTYGHDVSVLAINYRGDYWPTPLPLYRANMNHEMDIYGEARIIEMLGKIAPDVMVIVNDPPVVLKLLLDNPFDPDHVVWRGYSIGDYSYRPPILAYMPIDGYNTPKSWDILQERVTRIAMSKFGRDTAMPEAPVIWHGVDNTVFKVRDKAECKKELGFDPDRFLVLRVDKNSLRKDFPATWKALKPLLRKYPDIDVHFHTRQSTSNIDGFDLRAVRWNDEDIRDRVGFTSDMELGGFIGVPEERLALLYGAADLFVTTSHGEGFGLTLLESMASGTPVIATNCSAITEVVGDGGILIPPAGYESSPQGQDQCRPDIDAFTEAIEHLYLAGGVRRKLSQLAAESATGKTWEFAARAFNDLIVGATARP